MTYRVHPAIPSHSLPNPGNGEESVAAKTVHHVAAKVPPLLMTDRETMVISTVRRWEACALAQLAVITVGVSVLTPALADKATADASIGCLWADNQHPSGATVYAGGWSFSCGTGVAGASRWINEGPVRQPSTVPSPGADFDPTGRFSAGAIQPGTDYMDYCVGNQLVEGREAMYEAVPDGTGKLYWKAAGPSSYWTLDPGTVQPPSWRSSSMCYDGTLI
ncbi:hypothetical protein GCM10023319_20100 [Nocardia iowensis]